MSDLTVMTSSAVYWNVAPTLQEHAIIEWLWFYRRQNHCTQHTIGHVRDVLWADLLAYYWKNKSHTKKQTCVRNTIYYNIK